MDPEFVYSSRTVAMTWADPCELEVRPSAASMQCQLSPLSTECQSVVKYVGISFSLAVTRNHGIVNVRIILNHGRMRRGRLLAL